MKSVNTVILSTAGKRRNLAQVAADMQQIGIRNTACLVTPLKSGHLLQQMGPHYLRGMVWVASGETGHDPDVTSSYQAQGPSFLQYVPVKDKRHVRC